MNNENQIRDFKGIWMPADLYFNRDINWTCKIIFIEIDSFSSKGKDCFFSNEYLAEFMQLSVRQIQKCISRLITLGWIEQVGFDGRKRFLRTVKKFSEGVNHSSSVGRTEIPVSRDSKVTHNNTINKTINISFESFWNLYGKKVGDRTACEKKWNKLKGEEREKIMKTLPDFMAQWSDKQFQPYPATYLNQKRWNDELKTSTSKSSQKILTRSDFYTEEDYVIYCKQKNIQPTLI